MINTNFNNNWVIVPLGGIGKRLRPYTKERSKALVPLINNFPITEFAFYNLASELGFRHFAFGIKGYLNYLNVQSYYQGGSGWSAKLGLHPQANFQYQNPNLHDQGSAGSTLYNLKKFNIQNTVVVIPCDNFFSTADLKAMLELSQKSSLPFFIGLTKVDDPEHYGVVQLAKDGQTVQNFIEKPAWLKGKTALVNSGIYVIKPEAFPYLEGDFGQDTLPVLGKKGLLGGCRFVQPWYDFGSPQFHLESFQGLLTDSFSYLKPFIRRGYLQVPGKNVWIRGRDSYSRQISENIKKRVAKGEIKTEGTVLIGRDCFIGPHVRLKNTSIGDMAIVEGNTLIENSNILDGWLISQGAKIKNSFFGRCGMVADFSQIENSFLGDNVDIGTNRHLKNQTIGNHQTV